MNATAVRRRRTEAQRNAPTPDELNRLVYAGVKRAEELEPKLAALIEPILRQAGEHAADVFEQHAVALTAALDANPPTFKSPGGDEMLDVDKLVSSLRTKTDPVRNAVVESVMKPTLGAAGIDFSLTNPLTKKVLAQSGSQIKGIADTTQHDVMRIIDRSYNQGLSIPDTAKAIRVGMAEAAPARATLIARTELAGAVNGGSMAAVQTVSDVTGQEYVKRWLCVPPWTRVAAAGVSAVVKKPYDGDLVEVTTRRTTGRLPGTSEADGRFTVTPDHLVLTRRGWIPAGLLYEGDEVVGRALGQGDAWGDPDIDDAQPTIEEVFDSAAERRAAAGMVPTAMYFYRDRLGEQVDVVPAAGSLDDHIDISVGQELREFMLAVSDVGLNELLRDSATNDRLVGHGNTCASSVAETPACGEHGGIAVMPEQISFDLRSESGSLLAENHFDGGVRHADTATDLLHGNTGFVQFDQVTRVVRRPFTGHVYDVTTLSGWWFADDYVAHNTAPGAQFPRHETYEGLDGQTAPLDGLFQVGADQLSFPGDPAGDPGEVCNCRCVAPWTTVSGPLTAAMRRAFEGEVVRLLTASGCDVTVSPNHPVLTNAGWVAAGLIQEGDYVVRYRGSDGLPGGPDVDDMPAEAEQRFAALELAAASTQRVSSGHVDFHGDITEGEVDVVVADNVLAAEGEPPIFKRLRQLALALAHREMSVASDLTVGRPPLLLYRYDESVSTGAALGSSVAEDSGDGGACEAIPFAQSKLALSGRVGASDLGRDGFVALAERQPESIRSAAADPAFSQTGVDRHGAGADLARDLLVGHPALVEADQVIYIERSTFKGHLYNFSSHCGVYAADGLILANCTMVYDTPEGEQEVTAEEEGGDLGAVEEAAGASGQIAQSAAQGAEMMMDGVKLNAAEAGQTVAEADIATGVANWTRQLQRGADFHKGAIDKAAAANDYNLSSDVYKSAVDRYGPNNIVIAKDVQPSGSLLGTESKTEAAQRKTGNYTSIIRRHVLDNPTEELVPGQTVVGTDPATVLRHEYGHQINESLTGDQKAEFRADLPDRETVKNDLSWYASTGLDVGNEQEAFSELFAAVSDPAYNVDHWAQWVTDLGHKWFESPEWKDTVSIEGQAPLPRDLVARIRNDGLDIPLRDVRPGEVAQKILQGRKDTEQLYFHDGEWDQSREALHDQIIAAHFQDKIVPDAADRQAYMTAGGGASGKSGMTFLVGGQEMKLDDVAELKSVIHIDPDAIKKMIPEYQQIAEAGDTYAASAVHEESSALAKTIQKMAQDQGYSVLLDTTGQGSKFVGKIHDFHDLGYETHVSMVSIPTNEALVRAMARGDRSGRYVNTHPLKEAHRGASVALDLYRDDPLVNHLRVYDNTEGLNVVAEGGNGAITIHDPAKFDQILAKADEHTVGEPAPETTALRPVETRVSTPPPPPPGPAPKGSLSSGEVFKADAGDRLPAAALAEQVAQDKFLIDGLPNTIIHDGETWKIVADDGNRHEAKRQIAKTLSDRLANNDAWNAYLEGGGKTIADLEIGDEFEQPGAGLWKKVGETTVEGDKYIQLLPGKSGGGWGDTPLNFTPNTVVAGDNELIPVEGDGATKSERAAAGLINNWATTSSDSDAWALALQHAAQEEFGLPESAWDAAKHDLQRDEDLAAADSIYARGGSALRAFVRAMYEDTQEKLDAAGFGDTLTLYRGQGHLPPADFTWASREIDLQPISSFSSDIRVASRFVRSDGGMVAVQVPRSRIIGTARTGFGCLQEEEFIVCAAPAGETDFATIMYGGKNTVGNTAEGGPEVFWARAALDASKLGPEWQLAYDIESLGQPAFEYEGKTYVYGRVDRHKEGGRFVYKLTAFTEEGGSLNPTEIPAHARVKVVG